MNISFFHVILNPAGLAAIIWSRRRDASI